MIDEIRGVPVSVSDRHAILSIGAISFRLSCGLQTLSEISMGKECVKTYLHVREDELSLYGFREDSERELFLQLLSVSGIGQKQRLKFFLLGEEKVRHAIVSEDVALLFGARCGKANFRADFGRTSRESVCFYTVPIGKKNTNAFSEATEALEGLGFKKQIFFGLA